MTTPGAAPASASAARRFVPVHATELAKLENSTDYFDIEHVAQPGDVFSVSIGVVGEPEVGKTSLLMRFAKRQFRSQRIATVGIDHIPLHIKSNHPAYDRITHLTLLDTAGQERYNSFTATHLRNTDIVMIVFDATRRETFDACVKWREIIEKSNAVCVCVLVANKMDLYNEKDEHGISKFGQWMVLPNMDLESRTAMLSAGAVDLKDAAQKLGCHLRVWTMSAASGVNVDECIVELVDLAIDRQLILSAEYNKIKEKNKSASGAPRRQRGVNLSAEPRINVSHTTKIACCSSN